MTRTTKTKTEKAKRDPALVTGKKAAEAAAAFNAFAGDETSPEWVAVEKRTTEADAAFANALVTSAAGALAKMEALRATVMSPSIDPDETYLVARHFNTVVAFIQDFTGAPPAPGEDSRDAALLALDQEYVRLVDLGGKDTPGTSDDERGALYEQASRIECQICDTTPHTPAGLVVLVKLLASFQEGDPSFTDGRDGTLSRNILAALERLTPTATVPDPVVVAFPAPAPKPDPVIVMSAEWGAIQDEMMALSAANPESKSGENMDRWEAALERLRALEDQIIKTPATSIAGVALKLRIASHYECDGFDLADFHAVPAREINYDEAFGGRVRWETSPVISALLDVERMAGVS